MNKGTGNTVDLLDLEFHDRGDVPECTSLLAEAAAHWEPQIISDVESPHLVFSPRASSMIHGCAVEFPVDGAHPRTAHPQSMETINYMLNHVSLVSQRRFFLLRKKVVFLQDVSLYIQSGSLTCVLATDPARSRAVLTVLAGIEERAEGVAVAGAYPTSSSTFRQHTAYISTIHGVTLESTVRENILFAVDMRVCCTSSEDRESHVRDAAEATGITDILDESAHTLSQAQLYRLATAMELVTDPVLVLLDNPSAFCTPADTQDFVDMLDRLRQSNGRTVVITAQDLSLPVYNALTDVTVISTFGRVLFSGRKASIEEFFKHDLSIPNIQGDAIADLLAQVEDSGSTMEVAEAFHKSAHNAELRRQLLYHARSLHDGTCCNLTLTRRRAPSYWTRSNLLALYVLRRMVMNYWFLLSWASLLGVLFFMFVLLSFLRDDGQGEMQNRCGVIFFLLSCCIQLNTVFLSAEVREYFTFVHLRSNGYLTVPQYIGVTVLRVMLPRLVFCVLGACIAFIALERKTVLTLVVTMGQLSFVHSTLGILTAYWYPQTSFLWAAHHWYYGYCAIFSGFLISVHHIPVVVQVFSLLRYAYGGLVATDLRGRSFNCNASVSMYCFTGDQYLQNAGLADDRFLFSFIFYLVLGLVLMILMAGSMFATRMPQLAA